jgi:hypothetical protein
MLNSLQFSTEEDSRKTQKQSIFNPDSSSQLCDPAEPASSDRR